jgi:hypothetical protein
MTALRDGTAGRTGRGTQFTIKLPIPGRRGRLTWQGHLARVPVCFVRLQYSD